MRWRSVILVLLLVGCATLSKEDKFRIDSLYEHTLLMKELSTPELLNEIGLDTTPLQKTETMSYDDKLNQLEQAMRTAANGNNQARIKLLENRMNQMMQVWAQRSQNT